MSLRFDSYQLSLSAMGNMTALKKVFQTLFLSVIIVACLEPKGENVVPIQSPEESDITINLAGVDVNDTLYIDGITRFTYEVNGFPLLVRDAEVKLDMEPVYIAPYSGNTFTINPKNYPEGLYKMHVKLIAQSQNGSLAANLNREIIEISMVLNVILDSTPAPAAEIVKIDTTGGTLVIHWNKYDKKNFDSYTIRKQCTDSNNTYDLYQCEEIVINDQSITSWTDHDYVGGRVVYTVNISTHLQTTFGTPREFWWKPRFITEVDLKGNATIRWYKTTFFQNTQKCIIQPNLTTKLEVPITDTVYVVPDPLRFATLYELKVTFASTDPNRSQTFLHEYYYGTRYGLPVVRPSQYHAIEKLYYRNNGTQTIIMDEGLNVINEIPGYLYIQTSFSSNYFVTMIDNNFYNVDPRTLEKTLLLETGKTAVGDYVIADNGLIGFTCWGGFRVMDTNTGQEKFAAIPNNPPYYKLSPSGKYLISNNKTIYRYNGTAFVSEGQMPAAFHPDQPFIFTATDNILGTFRPPGGGPNQITLYDITTRTANFSLEAGTGYFGSLLLDPVSKKILISSSLLFDEERQTIVSVSATSLLNGKLFKENHSDFYTPSWVYVIDASIYE